MTPEERERWAEQWMNAALEQRRNTEPRAGLETRVLANLVAAKPRAVPLRWQWSWNRALAGIAIAAVLILAVIYALRPVRREPPHVAGKPVQVAPNAASNRSEAPALPIARPQVGKSAKKNVQTGPPHEPVVALASTGHKTKVVAPRMSQFPAPAPLTAQERLLLQYVHQTPREELVAIAKENQLWQERLRELGADTDAQRGPTQ